MIPESKSPILTVAIEFKPAAHTQLVQNLYSRLNLTQKSALVHGGLCLLFSLTLVLVSFFSNRYILLQQEAGHGHKTARESALEVADVMARGDLIGLEVSLEMLVSLNRLRGVRVYDRSNRQVGAAGAQAGKAYSAEVWADGKPVGMLHIYLNNNSALAEQKVMAFFLLVLALLLSVFVTVIGIHLTRTLAARLARTTARLQILEPESPAKDELEALEQAVELLPLDLLRGKSEGVNTVRTDHGVAGLLYVQLDSLASYVNILDETSLQRYIQFQQQLIGAAAQLYGGELEVVRKFGLLASFEGRHPAGSPVYRAASTAWLSRRVAGSLQSRVNLQLTLSFCCGLSELGFAKGGDVFSAFYCQPIIDDMEARVTARPQALLLTPQAAKEAGIAQLAEWEEADDGSAVLTELTASSERLLEGQHELVLNQFLNQRNQRGQSH